MLLFLDIDGVMVPANSWRRSEILDDGFPAFSPNATKALQRIIAATGAGIVLTTTHKSKYTPTQWRGIFNRRGISVNRINRLAENVSALNRKDELLKYFDKKSINEDFLIIDDDKSLNALPDYLKRRVIQPSGSVGLTGDLADEALSLLRKGFPELI